jgi:hypothetical protein
MRNNKFNRGNINFKRAVICSCGSEAKERIKRNYPFGRKSKCSKVTAYFCIACGKKQ